MGPDHSRTLPSVKAAGGAGDAVVRRGRWGWNLRTEGGGLESDRHVRPKLCVPGK